MNLLDEKFLSRVSSYRISYTSTQDENNVSYDCGTVNSFHVSSRFELLEILFMFCYK